MSSRGRPSGPVRVTTLLTAGRGAGARRAASGTRRGSRSPFSAGGVSARSCSCCSIRTCRSATRCSTRTAFRTCSAGRSTSRRSRRGTISSRTRRACTCSRFRLPAWCAAARQTWRCCGRSSAPPTRWRGSCSTPWRCACGRPPGRRARGRALPPHSARLRGHGGRQPHECVRAVALGRRAGAHGLGGRSPGAPRRRRGSHGRPRGGVPVAHQHVCDPVGGGVRHRVALLVARRAGAAVAGGRGRCSPRSRRSSSRWSSTTRTSSTPIAPSWPASAARPPRPPRCRRPGHRRPAGLGAALPARATSASRRSPSPPGVRRSSGRGARAIGTTLATTGWLLTCGLFLVLGILTPVDMRYYLAAVPALAIFAAAGEQHRLDIGRPGAHRRAGAARRHGFRRSACLVDTLGDRQGSRAQGSGHESLEYDPEACVSLEP